MQNVRLDCTNHSHDIFIPTFVRYDVTTKHKTRWQHGDHYDCCTQRMVHLDEQPEVVGRRLERRQIH